MSWQSMLLVMAQFITIVLLLILNDSVFNHLHSLIISSIGLVFGIYTLLYNRLGNFNIQPEIKKEAKLITTGAYKYIRHPMYLSVCIIMLGIALVQINLINIVLYELLIWILYLKAKREEELWSKDCEEYKEYMKHSKMFIPFVL